MGLAKASPLCKTLVMFKKIQDLLLNKFNLILTLISVSTFIYCLCMGQKWGDIYEKFLISILTIFWLIHPFINKKDLHVGAYTHPYINDDLLSQIARPSFFIIGVYGYFKVLSDMVLGK